MQLPQLVKILQEKPVFVADQQVLSYSDEYALVEAEQQKLNSLHGEKPDYVLIIQNASTLLQQGSGHFFILTALAHAMMQQYNWPGIVAGITLMQERLQEHWAELFPGVERLKGRVQSMSWLIERWQRYLETHPLNGLGKEFIQALEKKLTELDSTCQQYFSDQVTLVTLLRPVSEQLKRMHLEQENRARQQELEEERAKEQREKALEQTLDQNAETISTEEYLAGMDVIQLHTLASERLMTEQMAILSQSPLEFSIYKHNRAEMWWRCPLSSAELLTQIDEQGLNWEAYAEALKLKAKQNYQEAVLSFEALSHAHPYFLELQLQICECLQELNAEDGLINMLKNECRELCTRYPELEGAKIQGEWPVCSKQAKNYFGVFQHA